MDYANGVHNPIDQLLCMFILEIRKLIRINGENGSGFYETFLTKMSFKMLLPARKKRYIYCDKHDCHCSC